MLPRTNRSQCIVTRDKKILMVTHARKGRQWLCLPGGAIEENESPEDAAIRELHEECHVEGVLIEKTSEYADPFSGGHTYTFLVEIGDQIPQLGKDPEDADNENPVLIHIGWYHLHEICERDRAFLWAAGLISIREFAEELSRWGDDFSYPFIQSI